MIVRSPNPAALRTAHATIKIISDTAEILAESACALGEMFLIKRPFFLRWAIRRRLQPWQDQPKRRVLQRNRLCVSRDRSARFTPRGFGAGLRRGRRIRKGARVARRPRDLRRKADGKARNRLRFCWV